MFDYPVFSGDRVLYPLEEAGVLLPVTAVTDGEGRVAHRVEPVGRRSVCPVWYIGNEEIRGEPIPLDLGR